MSFHAWLIEAAAGQPWEELIYGRIFEPLGLATAGLGPQATFGKLDAPVGHRVADDTATPTMPVGNPNEITPIRGYRRPLMMICRNPR